MFFPNSFSYGVLANIGSGAVVRGRFRGSVPEQGSGEGFGAGSGQGSKEVPGGFRRSRQDSRRDVPERVENDLVADGGTGFRDSSLGEPVAVAVALVPALVLVWVVVVTDDRCNPLRT